jgi:hypothetical protein
LPIYIAEHGLKEIILGHPIHNFVFANEDISRIQGRLGLEHGPPLCIFFGSELLLKLPSDFLQKHYIGDLGKVAEYLFESQVVVVHECEYELGSFTIVAHIQHEIH